MADMVIITAESIYCIISMCRKILFGQGKNFTGQGKVREFSVAWSVATLKMSVPELIGHTGRVLEGNLLPPRGGGESWSLLKVSAIWCIQRLFSF